MAADAVPWRTVDDRGAASWPKPRAEVAVDLLLSSSTSNPPRVDKIVKFILDELAGVVYRDDRQVKLLFARHFRESERPGVYVLTQTLGDAFTGVRRSVDVDPMWRVAYANHAYEKDVLDWEPDEDVWDDGTAFGREWSQRTRAGNWSGRQEIALRVTDGASARLVMALAHRRRSTRGVCEALNELLDSPYCLRLGVLPDRHGDTPFAEAVAEAMVSFARARPDLVPVLPPVGVTVYVVEGVNGKDLDNVVLEVLPALLDVFQPTSLGTSSWSPVGDLERLFTGDGPAGHNRHVAFVEAVAIRAEDAGQLDPGTVVFALSHGSRFESWWENMNSFVDDVLDQRVDRRGDPFD